MSRFAKPLQFIEVMCIVAVVVLAWPITTPCGAPHKTCTPPPNEQGDIIRPTQIQPYGVWLWENYTRTDLPWYYQTSTIIDRPLLPTQPTLTASPSATISPESP